MQEHNNHINMKKVQDVYYTCFLSYFFISLMLLVVGYLGYSTIIVNSGFYFALNMILYAMMFIGVKVNSYEFTKKYPYGIGKLHFIFFSLVAVGISFASAISISISVGGMVRGALTYVDSIAVIAHVIAIVFNEMLRRYLEQASVRLSYKRFLKHSRETWVGLMVSVVAIACIILRQLGVVNIEYIGSICISVVILITSVIFLKLAFDGLTDYRSVKPKEVQKVIGSMPDITEIKEIKTRSIGYEMYELDLALVVDGAFTVKKAELLEKSIKEKIKEYLPNIKIVMVDFT